MHVQQLLFQQKLPLTVVRALPQHERLDDTAQYLGRQLVMRYKHGLLR
jgi:hypothetical protein